MGPEKNVAFSTLQLISSRQDLSLNLKLSVLAVRKQQQSSCLHPQQLFYHGAGIRTQVLLCVQPPFLAAQPFHPQIRLSRPPGILPSFQFFLQLFYPSFFFGNRFFAVQTNLRLTDTNCLCLSIARTKGVRLHCCQQLTLGGCSAPKGHLAVYADTLVVLSEVLQNLQENDLITLLSIQQGIQCMFIQQILSKE